MFGFLANPLVIKAATELLDTVFDGSEEEKKDKIKTTLKKYSVPFWKQKKFYVGLAGIAAVILNQLFDAGLPVEQIFCSGP